MAVCEDPVSMEWLQHACHKKTVSSFLSGTLKIPGFKPEVPKHAEDDSTGPPTPQLNLLTVSGANKESLHIPEDLLKKWYGHARFGADFRKWVDGFHEKFGEQNDSPQAGKRPRPARSDCTMIVDDD